MVRVEHFKLFDPSAPRHVTLTDAQQASRVMVVGDVHGCCDELCELLAEHQRPGDTVILAGDLVNKVPLHPTHFHPIASHPILSRTNPSHPNPYNPTPSHPILPHPNPTHPIPTYPIAPQGP